MSTSERIHEHIRSNAIGYFALFVALTIAPAWAGALDQKRTVTVLKAKVKKGPRGPAGPAGPAGPQGPAGAQGIPGPLSGNAGGELAGTYPNPQIGTVAGLDLEQSTSPTAGVNFGPDVSLYRDQFGQLRTDDDFRVTGNSILGDDPALDVTEVTGIMSFTFGSKLTIPTGTDTDTNHCFSGPHLGRLFYDYDNDVLYACGGNPPSWRAH